VTPYDFGCWPWHLLSVAESFPKRDSEEFTLYVTGLIKNLQ